MKTLTGTAGMISTANGHSTAVVDEHNSSAENFVRTLMISKPSTATNQAYLIEPSMYINLSPEINLADVTFESTNRHLILKMANGADIVLLDFITLSHSENTPYLQTADGQMFSGAQIVAQAMPHLLAEAQEPHKIDDLNAIEPAAGRAQFEPLTGTLSAVFEGRAPQESQDNASHYSPQTPFYNSPFYNGYGFEGNSHHIVLSAPPHPLSSATYSRGTQNINQPPQLKNVQFFIPEGTNEAMLAIGAPVDPEGSRLFMTVTGLPDPSLVTLYLSSGEELRLGMNLSLDELLSIQLEAQPHAEGSLGTFQYSVSDGYNISFGRVDIFVAETTLTPVDSTEPAPSSDMHLTLIEHENAETDTSSNGNGNGNDNNPNTNAHPDTGACPSFNDTEFTSQHEAAQSSTVLFKIAPIFFKAASFIGDDVAQQNHAQIAHEVKMHIDESLMLNSPFHAVEHTPIQQPKLFSNEANFDHTHGLQALENRITPEELDLHMVMSFNKAYSDHGATHASASLFASEDDHSGASSTATNMQENHHSGFSALSSTDVLAELGLDFTPLHS